MRGVKVSRDNAPRRAARARTALRVPDKNDARLNGLLPGARLLRSFRTEYNYAGGSRAAFVRVPRAYIPPLFFIRFACEPITSRLPFYRFSGGTATADGLKIKAEEKFEGMIRAFPLSGRRYIALACVYATRTRARMRAPARMGSASLARSGMQRKRSSECDSSGRSGE